MIELPTTSFIRICLKNKQFIIKTNFLTKLTSYTVTKIILFKYLQLNLKFKVNQLALKIKYSIKPTS